VFTPDASSRNKKPRFDSNQHNQTIGHSGQQPQSTRNSDVQKNKIDLPKLN
jgi:hypothetical protein